MLFSTLQSKNISNRKSLNYGKMIDIEFFIVILNGRMAQWLRVSNWVLTNLSNIISRNECACQCYSDQYCLTTIYFGINQQCSLYMARLPQVQMYVAVTIKQSSVLYSANKTLSCKYFLRFKRFYFYTFNSTIIIDQQNLKLFMVFGILLLVAIAWHHQLATTYTNFGVCTIAVCRTFNVV
jgi:hypothetical protein